MNIFVLDRNPVLAASYHCDKHVVKMIVETAQILSTAAHLRGRWREGMYRPTHKNHPCVLWAANSLANASWLVNLGNALCAEYRHRYGKRHKTQDVMELFVVPYLALAPNSFVLAMPEKYYNDDPVVAYRAYYRGEKASFATYRNSPVPFFMR